MKKKKILKWTLLTMLLATIVIGGIEVWKVFDRWEWEITNACECSLIEE